MTVRTSAPRYSHAVSSPEAEVGQDDIRRVETQLGALLRRTRAFIAETATDVHPELSATGYAMLARLVDSGPCRATELVHAFDTDKAAISRQTAHLVALGLVTRDADPADRRAQLLSITAEGTRRVRAARQRNQRRLRRGLADWQLGEVQELGRLLEKFNGLDLD
jgi:DNA-binding MarR family transcriptional regulator